MIPFNNISKLTQFYDVQPYLKIKVGSNTFSSIGTQPRFLSIANFSQSNTGSLDYCASLDVVLSDYDGALKTIMDAGTLLDSAIEIQQSFDDETAIDVLFAGKVTTPITWNESDRTIAFTIENGAQDVMLNDEDPVDDCEQEFMPFVFGDFLGVKGVNSAGGCRQVSKLLKPIMHTCINSQSGKITYASGDLYVKNGQQIFGKEQISLLVDGTRFDGAFSDDDDKTHFVLIEGGFNGAFRIGGITINARPSSATDDMQEYINPSLMWISEEAYDLQGKFARLQYQTEYWYTVNSDDSWSPTTEGDPAGVKTVETVCTATAINGIQGLKVQLENPPLDRFGRPVLLGFEKDADILEIKGKMDFSWNPAPTYNYPYRWDIAAGSEVTLYGNNTVWYVNQTASQAVVAVYGQKDGRITKIPAEWYTVDLTGPTTITFDRNLMAKGNFQSNDIWVDLTSWVDSNNIATVIKWLAENYCTGLTVDNTSYLIAKEAVSTLPCGFQVVGQKRSFDLMKELAYQGGLGLVVLNGKLYFKDITVAPTGTGEADYVVSMDKTEFRSCSITTNNETDVITHFIGTYWESNYPNDEQHRIVRVSDLKDKFKKKVMNYDFFAFNQKDCVIRVMEFYMQRFTNLWQQLKIKTFLTSLNVNPFDKVALDIPYSAGEFGIVTGWSYDPSGWDIELTIETDKGLFDGDYWGTLVGTTPGSIFTTNEVELDVVFDDLSRNPVVQLLPTKFFYDTDPNKLNPVDTSNIDTTRDSCILNGKITAISGDYLTVDLVDPYDSTKALNWNNYSSVNKLPDTLKPGTTTLKVAKPPNLKKTFWNGKTFTIQGKTITYTAINDYSRTASAPGYNSETQAETPPYFIGEVIEIAYNGRGTGTKDENGDPILWTDKKGREFAVVSS